MRSDDISRDIGGPRGPGDVGMRVGRILSWNNLTGANTVEIEGEVFTDLKAVQGGIGIQYTPGDVVAVMRKETTYFIFGRVASVGGTAGSAVVSDSNGGSYTTGSSGGVFTNFPDNGPSATTYIGASRTALVIWTADVAVNQSKAEIGWAVSGASTIPAAPFAATTAHLKAQFTAATVTGTITGTYVMRGSGGLKQGTNTFTLQYKTELLGGTGADYGNRSITVIPL